MRLMVLVKATKESEDGVMPTTELFDAMTTAHRRSLRHVTVSDAVAGGRAQPGDRALDGVRAAAGLSLIADIEAAPLLQDYAPLPAAKGDFLFRAGRRAEVRAAFERAAWLTRNEHERIFCSRARRHAAIEGRRGDTEKKPVCEQRLSRCFGLQTARIV